MDAYLISVDDVGDVLVHAAHCDFHAHPGRGEQPLHEGGQGSRGLEGGVVEQAVEDVGDVAAVLVRLVVRKYPVLLVVLYLH